MPPILILIINNHDIHRASRVVDIFYNKGFNITRIDPDSAAENCNNLEQFLMASDRRESKAEPYAVMLDSYMIQAQDEFRIYK